MQPLRLLLLLHLLLIVSTAAQNPPAPESEPEPTEGSAPAPAPPSKVVLLAPAPPPEKDPGADGNPSPAPAPDSLSPDHEGDVVWCAVSDEYDDCLKYTSLLTRTLNWTCVLKKDKGACMDAIRDGEADLISLEAGYAYIAFKNKSMKAIMSEEYSFHAQSYAAVAVVRREMCDRNPRLSFENFRNFKSCHPGYQTSGGWNFPVLSLLKMGIDPRPINTSTHPNDVKTITSFFSASCAPSELGYGGICSACGNDSACSSFGNIYTGQRGAFRCLMDGTGDIAFLRPKTPQIYSSDGQDSQKWSTKSLDEFMYLCPGGGCKAINDNYGSCVFATVPSNPIMTRNNISTAKKNAIVEALLTANWTSVLYTGKNWQSHLLSVSTQALTDVNQLTRRYLSTSGEVSQIIQDLNNNILVDLSATPKITASIISLAFGVLTSGILGFFLL